MKYLMIESEMSKKVSFFLIDLPVLRNVYDWRYAKVVRKKSALVSNPVGISIETINTCNLRCIMCPYQAMTRPKTVMSMELYRKVLSEAMDMGIKSGSLTFYNEAFMDPFLTERIKIAKSMGFEISFFSNGTMLTEENIKKILDCPPDVIFFSVDGATKATYESIRIGANFESVIDGIKRLIDARNARNQECPKIAFNFTVQKKNHKEVKKFKKMWGKKADFIYFGTIDNRYVNDYLLGFHKHSKVFACRRLFNDINVTSDGTVALCCMDADCKQPLGNANKQTLREIWDGVWKQYRQLHTDGRGEDVPFCKGCSQLRRQSSYVWWF
jgi:MoaA/NifB/PqqE/SkfB family radical SAM enzyme